MKKLRASAFAKLMIALIVIALLTGCAYFGVFGVAFTVVGADDWAGAVLNLAMTDQTQSVYDYYYLTEQYKGVKEKDIPEWAKEELARYKAMFDPETTNFRFEVMDESGKKLFGNYEGEAYLARSYDWEQRFEGTDIEQQRLRAYENGALYDYENDVYLTDEWYPIDPDMGYPEEFVWYDNYGNFYGEHGNLLAKNGAYNHINGGTTMVSPTPSPAPMDTAISVVPGTSAEIVVDGVRMYPIDRNAGYPEEFAYVNEYNKIFDRDFNYIMHMDEYVEEQGYRTQDVTPVPTPSPVATKTPQPLDLPKTSITPEEYEELREKCYTEYVIRGYIPEEMPIDDMYHSLYMRVVQYDLEREDNLDSAIALGVTALILLVVLLFMAGKRNEEGEYVEAGLGRLPWDAWIVVIGCLSLGAFLVVFLAAELVMESFRFGMGMEVAVDTDLIDLAIKGCVAAAAVCVTVLVGTLHSAAARVKVRDWWRNCLCWKALVWCWKWCKKLLKWCWKLWLKIWRWFKSVCGGIGGGLRKIPLIWKAVVVLGVLWMIETVYVAANVWSTWAVVGILWNTVKLLIGIIICLMLKRLQQGARTIADGNLDHRIETKNLFGDFQEHAECLNRIGDGLSRSVDAQLRSERMKTELITNVSHDLKTPLTSIVNYVDLLKKEELTGTAAEYVEVLDRQSARLKKLTEDLVEASKASTGSLNVSVERVSVGEIIEQASAEYAVRLGENGLQTIVRQPDEEVTVWADGKYVWRILDNLLSNVCKYAMPNTRVYLELRKEADFAVLSVKNMSRESLNISAEELMERFVRGDSSRNTEGSGLGLSIAQNLAKLMGGEVRLTVDGDLFKAEVTLPLAK